MAQNEIQVLSLYGGPASGTAAITFDGQTTSGIAYNASAATIQSALEALSNIGAGNVACSGGPWPGSSVTCEFQSALAGTALPEMIIDPSGLSGGAITASIAETTKGGPDLDTSLAAYWKCDESSGDLLDSEASYDLVETSGSISSDTGIQTLSRKGSSAAAYFVGSGVSFSPLFNPNRTRTFGGWIKLNLTTDRNIFQAFYSSSTYMLLSVVSSKIRFKIRESGGTLLSVTANTFGSLSASTWYYVHCSVDTSTGDYSVGVNGQIDSANYAGGFWPAGFGEFRFTPYGLNIDEWSMWDGRVLTSSEIGELYAAGVGRTYPLPTGDNELQTLTVSGSPSAGSLTLGYLGEYAVINYDSTAASADTALEAISGIGSGNLTCAGGPLPGTPITITFTGSLAATDFDLLELNYDALLCNVETTQDGAPTPDQATFALSSATLTPHITGASAAFSSGSVTASGNPEQATLASSVSTLQAIGTIDSSLPTATLTSGTALSAKPQQATATFSSGTVIAYGVANGPARLKFKIGPFAADLDPVPAQIVASAGTITPFSGILSPATLVASSANAIPVVEATGPATMSIATTEVTLELFGVPISMELSAAEVLSPVLEQATLTLSSNNVYEKQIAAPGLMGLSTFRIIDQDLVVVTITNKAISVPELTSPSLSIPQLTGETLLTPGLVSEALI